ncbi:MAG: peptidylprolyl isomerase, partial [Lachnospiraceae bacterium]|nr:peptidylprolyl isomerase [Lachnospiraceae bacterium]
LLANKMFYIATDDADVDVSDEEARQAQIQYIFLGTGRTGDDGAEIVLSKKEKKAVEKRANKLLAEARKTDHFSELAEKKSDAAQTEIIMGGNETSLPGEVVSAAMGLKTGELSTLIETSNGYYILYCANEKDADATYEKKEEIIAARQERMFKEKYSRWLGENEIEISKSFWKIFHV